MRLLVESARLVVDGVVAARAQQRIQALRLLGIGLFLTGRTDGAETVFFELLRRRPDARLDPATTRPEVVAFFEKVRTDHRDELRRVAESSPRKTFAWNFLPPAGQFQNGHRAKGWTIAALEVLSLGGALVTKRVLDSWEQPGHTFGPRADSARTLKALNGLSVAVLFTSVVVGFVDGAANFSPEPAADPRLIGFVSPDGTAGIAGRF